MDRRRARGRTITDGCSGSCRISRHPARNVTAVPSGSPVPGLRAYRGWAPPETWTRSRCPGANRCAVGQRVTGTRATPPGPVGKRPGATRTRPSQTFQDPPAVHVAEPHEDVQVRQFTADLDLGADRADHLHRHVERRAGVGQHVRPRLHGPVVHRARPLGDQERAAERRRGFDRVVPDPVRRGRGRRGRREGAPGVQVPPGRRGRRGPVGQVPPATAGSPDVHPHLARRGPARPARCSSSQSSPSRRAATKSPGLPWVHGPTVTRGWAPAARSAA